MKYSVSVTIHAIPEDQEKGDIRIVYIPLEDSLENCLYQLKRKIDRMIVDVIDAAGNE
jgi:hypothetical protein